MSENTIKMNVTSKNKTHISQRVKYNNRWSTGPSSQLNSIALISHVEHIQFI